MNILIFEYKNFGIEDVTDALTNMGHTSHVVSSELIRERVSVEFDQLFDLEYEQQHYDCVFTFNYSPALSNNCKRVNTPYIAFVYDSPLVSLYSYTIINPCNHVFLFDKTLYEEFHNQGISTVHYMPLAVNVARLDHMRNALSHSANNSTDNILDRFSSEIAFIGSMYNEKHNLYERLNGISPRTAGYLEGIMESQLQVYGYYFIEDMLTSNILEDMQKSAPITPNKDGVETVSYMYAYYFIARKLAEKERQQILTKLSNRYNVKLFTPNPTPALPQVHDMGPVDYYNDMPYIFQNSKINLNISLRSIRSGIPLRCMDIMGAEGFLLSNYQADFYEHFIPGEDLILYESQDDLLTKCNYYLSHDAERRQIAANGYGKVKESHTYEVRLKEIFEIVFR
ncbi:MAG: DUF3880 domain-containing protein [Lachnospira sp.]|nr:DUF3880 domain-containing protein [Lachnospira sp.]